MSFNLQTNTTYYNISKEKLKIIENTKPYSGLLCVYECQICHKNYQNLCKKKCDPNIFGYIHINYKSGILHCWNCLNKNESLCMEHYWLYKSNRAYINVNHTSIVDKEENNMIFWTQKGKIYTNGNDLETFITNLKYENSDNVKFKIKDGSLCTISHNNGIGIPFSKELNSFLLSTIIKTDSSMIYSWVSLKELLECNPFLIEILRRIRINIVISKFNFEIKNINNDFLNMLKEHIKILNEYLFHNIIYERLEILPNDILEKILKELGGVILDEKSFHIE